MFELNSSWVFFEVSGHKYGLQTKFVREMIVMGKVTKLASAQPFVRGLVQMREQVLTAIDLRALLGLRGLHVETEELIANFGQRKQDHINWLTELRASVAENREFKLTTDPHKCAFGKWYDSYQASDPVLSVMLAKFDRPHQRIHSIGVEARRLVAEGRSDEALALIDRTWHVDLAVMVNLFDQTAPMFWSLIKEVVVVLAQGTNQIGVVVDAVTEVGELDPRHIEPLTANSLAGSGRDLFLGVAKVRNSLALMFDGEKLFAKVAAAA